MSKTKRTPHEYDYKVSRVQGYGLEVGGTAYGSYINGEVVTPHGIVGVYGQTDWSTYRFVFDGRVYYRSEEVGRSKRGLTVAAGRFAKAVAARAGAR